MVFLDLISELMDAVFSDKKHVLDLGSLFSGFDDFL